MGLVTGTSWAMRMDSAVKAKDRDAIAALVDESLDYEEHRDRGARRVGRWWSAFIGREPDVNDLEDHQLTGCQLHDRRMVRQQMREEMIQSFTRSIDS